MVLRGLIGFLGGALASLLGFLIAWFVVRNRNLETRRKRAEILLVLTPFVFVALLFVVFLISR